MAAKDPHVRRISATAAGRARVAQADPAAMTAARRAGAAKANSPTSLARRLVKAWPDISAEVRAEVRDILAPLVAPDPPSRRRQQT